MKVIKDNTYINGKISHVNIGNEFTKSVHSEELRKSNEFVFIRSSSGEVVIRNIQLNLHNLAFSG